MVFHIIYIEICVTFVSRYNMKTNFYFYIKCRLKVAARGQHCPGHSSRAGSVILHPAVTPLVNDCSN